MYYVHGPAVNNPYKTNTVGKTDPFRHSAIAVIATYLCTQAPSSFEQDPLGMSTDDKYLLTKEHVLRPSIKSENKTTGP